MNFGFSEEQDLLRSTARKFLENECPSVKVRALMDGPEAMDPALWAKLAEQGWLGLISTGECGRVGAARSGGRFTLSGTKLFVHDAHTADAIVVAARTSSGKTAEDGITLFLLPRGTAGLEVTLLPAMDQTRKLSD